MGRILLLYVCLWFSSFGYCQELAPGFDASEYLELIQLGKQQYFSDQHLLDSLTSAGKFKKVYASPEMGLKNQWDYWERDGSVGIVVIRGTVSDPASWLENLYAASVPAKGSLQINDSTRFDYTLAANAKAKVHVGWTFGLAHLMPDIVKQLKAAYARGVHSFILFGHSQGAAITYLVRSYLEYSQELPSGLVYKTYCSAPPKPGNIYYANDFDFVTRNGWALRVVNSEDWVPETPFTIQTLKDMNEVNPFGNVDAVFGKQKWPVRWFLKSKYRKMDKVTRKAEKTYRKTLGNLLYSRVKVAAPGFKEPEYSHSMQYMTAGLPIVLAADSSYQQHFPFDGKNVFVHHNLGPYEYLVRLYYPVK
ncbi:lipase family protein [Flavihumibacter petaseus]|uniref:Fungal lipase-type domain-containing protein n=1 Tax=Flavihumibacter petaseus NBRC 106054 TaxID=1220578 RepID=A0A0E9MXC9_9BACT|nr:hypothetical protein [Flavihumibacter petaseus]GAO42269.1 hypothetical protein FPE01S_01_12820 [Flavihumibacter petaseus NBRC 106054]